MLIIVTVFWRFSYAGIPVKIIRGMSKSAGYRPGMSFADRRFKNSWAVVHIDSSWRFIDCHWGARHISRLQTTSYYEIYTGAPATSPDYKPLHIMKYTLGRPPHHQVTNHFILWNIHWGARHITRLQTTSYYMHMALFRVRDGLISAQVSKIFHKPLGHMHFLARFPMFLCTFKRFHNFIFPECEMGISRTWCQSGEFVLECENMRSYEIYILSCFTCKMS